MFELLVTDPHSNLDMACMCCFEAFTDSEHGSLLEMPKSSIPNMSEKVLTAVKSFRHAKAEVAPWFRMNPNTRIN
jgi:hypothetical protein